MPFYEPSGVRRERIDETEEYIKNCIAQDPCTEDILGATYFNELF